ncbi:MAG: hypothetical protein PHT41_02945 [Candidatus Omnitrophica bacterium]|nr:hypothetical protein [Candidatus Omnitrophota bacterium]
MEVIFRFHYLLTDARVSKIWHPPEEFWNEYDPLLGWKHIPDKIVRHAYGDIPVFINNDGFRSKKEYDVNQKKIFALGCSFTFGDGVAGDDAWPQRLEVKLKEGGFPYQVINMGVSAYGIDQMYLWFLEKQDLKPDIVILAIIPYDIARVSLYRWMSGRSKPKFKITQNRLVFEAIPVPVAQPGYLFYRNWQDIFFDFRKSYLAGFIGRRFNLTIASRSATINAESLQLSSKFIELFAGQCRKIYSKFLIVFQPYSNRGFLSNNLQDLKILLEQRGIAFIDISGIFQGETNTLLLDFHPSVIGHELIATSLSKFLLQNNRNYLRQE